MSEFSASFHLRATKQEEAIALLRRAKAPGFVFAPENGFVTFVCPRDEAAHRAVLAANAGRLVDYSFAADHGCWVDVYDRDAKVASLAVDFDDPSARFERSKFVALRLLGEDDAEDVAAWMRGSSDEESRSGRQAHLIARKLHLPRFAWLSYEYARTDETPPDGRIEVDRDGGAHRVEEAEQDEQDEIEELLATLPPTRKPPPPSGAAPPRRAASTKAAPAKPRPGKSRSTKAAPKKSAK